ncbi:MAG: hypothetical protein AAF799_46740 [Myxococcota bacterium]
MAYATRWMTLGALALALGCGDDGSNGRPGANGSGTGVPSAATTTLATEGSSGAATPSADDTTTADDTTDGTTASGTTEEPGSSEGSDSTGPGAKGCPADHVCFELEGEFHVPTPEDPTAIYDIPLPPGVDYRVVEVQLEFDHTGWYPDDPAGLHNIFWLHRGTFADFTWVGGVVGYVNARGPGTNIIRTRHDLDVTDLADSRTFNINGVALADTHTYQVFYRYDTIAGEVLVEIHEGEMLVAQGTDVPTTDLVRNTEDSLFIWLGNGTDVEAPGPEVPSLGWRFRDLRVELIP